jgi:hypothetical protein
MKAVNSNTLVLPGQLLHQAPTCWHKEKLWFDDELHEWRIDHDIKDALIAEGIGEHKCPTIGEWAAFSIAGSIVATLTGKYMIPPDPEPFDWTSNLEHYIWEALWQAVQENEAKLDRTFVAAMLRSFLPREHYAPPERPYRTSNFVSHWRNGEYPDTLFHSVSNLRLGRIKSGRESMDRLPQTVATSIREVAQHVPPMLEIAIKRIRRTYIW